MNNLCEQTACLTGISFQKQSDNSSLSTVHTHALFEVNEMNQPYICPRLASKSKGRDSTNTTDRLVGRGPGNRLGSVVYRPYSADS